jgi:hypothetical protein
MSCVIKQCHVVEAPHMAKPWVLETEEVQGRTFVRLNKWDYGLCRFLSHKALNFRKRTQDGMNLGIMDRLCQIRNSATDQLYAEHTQQPIDVDEKKKRRAYVRVARSSDLAFLPDVVDINLPSVKADNNEVIDGHRTLALTKGLRTTTLYLELSIENLEYIHNCAVRTSTRGRRRQRRKTTKGDSTGGRMDDEENEEMDACQEETIDG